MANRGLGTGAGRDVVIVSQSDITATQSAVRSLADTIGQATKTIASFQEQFERLLAAVKGQGGQAGGPPSVQQSGPMGYDPYTEQLRHTASMQSGASLAAAGNMGGRGNVGAAADWAIAGMMYNARTSTQSTGGLPGAVGGAGTVLPQYAQSYFNHNYSSFKDYSRGHVLLNAGAASKLGWSGLDYAQGHQTPIWDRPPSMPQDIAAGSAAAHRYATRAMGAVAGGVAAAANALSGVQHAGIEADSNLGLTAGERGGARIEGGIKGVPIIGDFVMALKGGIDALKDWSNTMASTSRAMAENRFNFGLQTFNQQSIAQFNAASTGLNTTAGMQWARAGTFGARNRNLPGGATDAMAPDAWSPRVRFGEAVASTGSARRIAYETQSEAFAQEKSFDVQQQISAERHAGEIGRVSSLDQSEARWKNLDQNLRTFDKMGFASGNASAERDLRERRASAQEAGLNFVAAGQQRLLDINAFVGRSQHGMETELGLNQSRYRSRLAQIAAGPGNDLAVEEERVGAVRGGYASAGGRGEVGNLRLYQLARVAKAGGKLAPEDWATLSSDPGIGPEVNKLMEAQGRQSGAYQQTLGLFGLTNVEANRDRLAGVVNQQVKGAEAAMEAAAKAITDKWVDILIKALKEADETRRGVNAAQARVDQIEAAKKKNP